MFYKHPDRQATLQKYNIYYLYDAKNPKGCSLLKKTFSVNSLDKAKLST
jgi:hypothetical protein